MNFQSRVQFCGDCSLPAFGLRLWTQALHKYVARCIRSCGSKDMNLLSRRSIVEAKTAGALLSERGNAGTLV
uniref:Uncharacterized protein n=1 Tax=Physcomitrium patens TaxID=3218 RepID=A0A2K1K7J6_PHYPA|nr:hypothetical protein PHYPA_011641 [Physcomitrium patens]